MERILGEDMFIFTVQLTCEAPCLFIQMQEIKLYSQTGSTQSCDGTVEAKHNMKPQKAFFLLN